MLVNLTIGVNFINILQKAFRCADPKSAERLASSLYFWHIWDLRSHTKAASKMLVSLTIGLISSTFYEKLLRVQIPKAQKDWLLHCIFDTFGICARAQKLLLKCWWTWLLVYWNRLKECKVFVFNFLLKLFYQNVVVVVVVVVDVDVVSVVFWLPFLIRTSSKEIWEDFSLSLSL